MTAVWLCIPLQWGRNLTVAEGAVRNLRGRGAKALQWGRNLTVAEGRRRRQVQAQGQAASMGPQLDSCGRVADLQYARAPNTASMGPQLDSCGRGKRPPGGSYGSLLQWGRNLTVAEGRRA